MFKILKLKNENRVFLNKGYLEDLGVIIFKSHCSCETLFRWRKLKSFILLHDNLAVTVTTILIK